jgi:hypothetical protein
MKKMPKSKATVYLVSRHDGAAEEGIPIGVFLTYQSADDYSGMCEQQMHDKGITVFHFRVHPVMFYNE